MAPDPDETGTIAERKRAVGNAAYRMREARLQEERQSRAGADSERIRPAALLDLPASRSRPGP